MKTAIEWLNEVGETVANEMFSRDNPPGTNTEALIARIQDDARADYQAALVSVRTLLGLPPESVDARVEDAIAAMKEWLRVAYGTDDVGAIKAQRRDFPL